MRFFRILCALTLTMVGVPPGASPRSIPASGPAAAKTATAATLDLQAYLAELGRWSSAAAKLKDDPERAAKLRRLVPDSWKVTIGNEQFEVPTEWLRDTLISLETNHRLAADYSSEIQTRLARMQAEALAMCDQVETANRNRPQEVRERLDRILRQSEFADVHGPTALDRLRERIKQWLYDRLSQLFGRLGTHPVAIRRSGWILTTGLLLLFITLLARAFLGRRAASALDLSGPFTLGRGWRDWVREARLASERGDYRDAIHLAYWASIYRLEETGLWQVDRTRTHREYLRLVPRDYENESRRASLADLTLRFERVWYGGQPASSQDFATVISQLETLGCQFP